MKKIFLYAYDHMNLGDDLFVRTIADRYLGVRFYLWSDKKNYEVFKNNRNIKVINQNAGIIKILKKIRPSLVIRLQEILKNKCDAIVYIGGSIFMEYPTWENIVNWWKYQVEKYDVYVLGANFGPYQSSKYKLKMEENMKKMKDICFRDRYSYQLFESLPQARFAPDILFSYPIESVEKKKKQIYISVINCKKKEEGKYSQYRKQYEKILKKIMMYYLDENYIIKLVSFCKEEGDEETIIDVLNTFQKHNKINQIQQLNYDGTNHKEVIMELVSSEYVIATRFHAIILGMVGKQKMYPIVYSDKSKNMLEDIGFKGNYLSFSELDKFKMEDVIQNKARYSLVDIGYIQEQSKKHFMYLDSILKIN